MKRKLPLGIQEFAKIREQGYCYIDKTARIYELITGTAGPVFLSRPRRFGKSLLCSTLGAVFEGRRELFGSLNGQPPLAISTLDWEWKKHPVIRIDLNPGNYAAGIEHLNARLRNSLDDTARNTGLSLRGDVAAEQFYNLIRDMSAQGGQKTVVIIDEYDKPLLAAIDTPETHREIRNALKAFYGVLKSSDAHLQFVLLTLEKKVFTLAGLQKFNADNMDAVAVLYQSGYLTIVDYDEEFNEYTLDYPNEEVRSAFADALLEHYVSAADVNALDITVPAGTGKDHAGF